MQSARHLAQRQPPVRRPLDQSEQRPQFLLGRDQGFKARPQHHPLAADQQRRLPPRRVGRPHIAATSPELSRLKL